MCNYPLYITCDLMTFPVGIVGKPETYIRYNLERFLVDFMSSKNLNIPLCESQNFKHKINKSISPPQKKKKKNNVIIN